ncbi:MAG: hypothetical protein Q7V88_05605 [Actinomycetota bacterium]|nr:hypothetical protein [Actinomycetota bacterium]
MLLFVLLCLVLVGGSDQRRIGDSGEYTAMAYQFARLRPPAPSVADIADIDRHYAGLWDRMEGYQGSVRQYPRLLADGRYDQPHFWIYPLAVAPLVKVAHLLDVPDTYGFAVFNIALAALAFGVVVRRKGVPAAALLFASPLLWWIDKPHGEVLVFCLLLLALLWARDRPHLGLVCMAVLVAHNFSFALALPVYAGWLALQHRRALFDTARRRWALLAAGVIVVMHPLYYLLRLGVFDPTMLIEDNSFRIPTVTRLVTPLIDPYVGLLVWWPALFLLACAGGVRRAWSRPLGSRSPAEWALVWAPFVLACAVLVGQAQNRQPASGGTFAMSRYAIWLAPFAVFAFDVAFLRGRWRSPLAAAALTASMALSVHVAHPDRPDVWWTLRPTFVAEALLDHAPWAWNPPPQVFVTREVREFELVRPVANRTCTKLLAVSGVWPAACPTPKDAPHDCLASYFCYANRSGAGYSFVALREYG